MTPGCKEGEEQKDEEIKGWSRRGENGEMQGGNERERVRGEGIGKWEKGWEPREGGTRM